MSEKYADFHSHPHFRAYNFLRNSDEFDGPHYHPWTVIISNKKQQEQGGRGFSYSQTDLVQLQKSGTRLVFASLYPFEKGFFAGNGRLDGAGVNKVMRIIDMIPVLGDFIQTIVLKRFMKKVFDSSGNVTSVKDHFQTLLMRMPMSRVNFIQSRNYDYWRELHEEYRFLTMRHNVKQESEVWGPWFKRTWTKLFRKTFLNDTTKATGTYFVAKNSKEATEAIAQDKIVFILTIEGMLSFGTDTNITDVMDRIRDVKQWQFPIFFITFSHHFWSGLCGHAHSMPRDATLFVNQDKGMNAGINTVGLAAMRLFLSLDQFNVRNEAMYGRRIHIDVKHMSAHARRFYYKEIVKPALALGDNIPVIASHVGYSGVRTLDALVNNQSSENDGWQPHENLNGWNINICDEDIEMVLKTGGMIGLNFDERILGESRKKNDRPKGHSMDLIMNNILGMVEAVAQSQNIPANISRSAIWSSICIGTDFEGYVDPVDEYGTVESFGRLRTDLIAQFKKDIFDANKTAEFCVPAGATPASLVEGICFGNLKGFMERWF